MKTAPALIGVIHLPPLPGAPLSDVAPSEALQRAAVLAAAEASALAQAGFEAVILENFGDTPFYKDNVPPETVASMAVVAAAVRGATDLPVGINVLRNDARSALAIAAVTGCDFIRVNVLSGVAAADQGILEGDAAYLIRERQRLAAPVAILADVHVKHARSLSSDDIVQAFEDTALRAMADGVIVSGSGTGKEVDLTKLARVCEAAAKHGVPVYVGSGANPGLLPRLQELGAGVIVSSWLRENGRAGAPLDRKRTREFVMSWNKSAVRGEKKKKLRK